jgi:hypothetical protein
VFLFFQDHVLQKVFDMDLRKNGFSKISRKEEDKESSNSSLSLSLLRASYNSKDEEDPTSLPYWRNGKGPLQLNLVTFH